MLFHKNEDEPITYTAEVAGIRSPVMLPLSVSPTNEALRLASITVVPLTRYAGEPVALMTAADRLPVMLAAPGTSMPLCVTVSRASDKPTDVDVSASK